MNSFSVVILKAQSTTSNSLQIVLLEINLKAQSLDMSCVLENVRSLVPNRVLKFTIASSSKQNIMELNKLESHGNLQQLYTNIPDTGCPEVP
ncbi:hypothetical protein J6590_028516 [Homalodisca vitripennis]|nr:hypothetical protein J6590_028516 [Homalodisca vitripennis]